MDDSVAFLRACAGELILGRVRNPGVKAQGDAKAQLCLTTWGYVSYGHWADGRAQLPRDLASLERDLATGACKLIGFTSRVAKVSKSHV